MNFYTNENEYFKAKKKRNYFFPLRKLWILRIYKGFADHLV